MWKKILWRKKKETWGDSNDKKTRQWSVVCHTHPHCGNGTCTQYREAVVGNLLSPSLSIGRTNQFLPTDILAQFQSKSWFAII